MQQHVTEITNFQNWAEETTLGIPIICFVPCNPDVVGHEQYLLRQLGQHSPGLITGFLHLMLGHCTGRHWISPCCNKQNAVEKTAAYAYTTFRTSKINFTSLCLLLLYGCQSWCVTP